MIPITKEESMKIRSLVPYAPIVRTVKQKYHRHRYFLAEETRYLKIIPENPYAAKILAEMQKEQS